MAKFQFKVGSTSQTVNIFIQDSSVTTGDGLTGLVFDTAGLTAYYVLPRANSVPITLVTLADPDSAWSSGGFKEIDATNLKGLYRLDIPNLALASGRFVTIGLRGASNMAITYLEIELTAIDNQDAVRAGMTALPNATAGGAAGLPVVGTGTNNFKSDGSANVTFANTSIGSVSGAVGSVTGLTASDVGAIKTKTDFLPSATAGAAGGVFIAGTNAATTITTGLTTTFTGNLTGNVNGSVGSVTGLTASDVGAIKTKTDFLPSATAGAAGGVFIAGTNAPVTITGAGNALTLTSTSGNGHGLAATGQGTGSGLRAIAGATGTGIGVTTTAGHAISAVATGTTAHGIHATGGATTSNGINAVGGGVGHGMQAQSGGGATGNGIHANAASTNGSGIAGVKSGSGSDLLCSSTPLTLAKTTNITGFNDIAATSIVSSGAINTSGGAVSTVSAVTGLTASDVGAIKTKTDFLPSATAGAAGGVFIAGSNAATSITSALTANITGNISGNVSGTINGLTAAALADFFDTDSGTTYGAAVAGSVVKEIADNAGGSALTEAGIADAVWEELIADHSSTSGSVAEALAAASAAGDPWAVALPGAYGSGTAGSLIGRIPDVAAGAAGGLFIAGTNAATSITTALTANITGNLSGTVGSVTGAVGSVTGLTASDVGAIKTKTDFLPSATAGAAGGVFIAGSNAATSITTALTANITGDVSGSVGSVTGAVGSVAGNVDGSVASVVGHTPQTGDTYALANGASGFVAVKADTAEIGTAGAGLTDITINAASVAAIFAGIVEGTTTFVQFLRLAAAALYGKSSGLETTTATYRNEADNGDRIVATVDADGNRSAVTLTKT